MRERLGARAIVALFAAGCAPGEIDPGAPADTDEALACSASAAEPAAARPGSERTAPLARGGSESARERPRPTYLPVTPIGPGRNFASGGAVFYLNRSGATLSGNYDDASKNQSSVVASQSLASATIPAGTYTDAQWSSIVACVKDEYSRFNITITDQRPTTAGYFMAMFGGSSSVLNLPANVGGVAPIDPNGCQTIDGAVVFIFSGSFGNDPQLNCEIAAQEMAHAFSLDHEFLASDPMTYLQYNGHKTFQDQAAQCGEYQARACICQRPSQDSVQVLLSKLGPSNPNPMPTDTTPPTVAISSPSSGTTQPEGTLSIVVHATDNVGVAKVVLHYQDGGGSMTTTCGDGQVVCNVSGADSTFQVPNAKGTATFFATAQDAAGNSGTSPTVSVTLTPMGNPNSNPNPNPNPNPSGGKITIAVDMDSNAYDSTRVVVPGATVTTSSGTISQVTLLWTDGKGQKSSHPMCPSGGNRWTLPVQVALLPGQRSFQVQAADSAGDSATSTAASFDVQ
jgi:hypothetical protein